MDAGACSCYLQFHVPPQAGALLLLLLSPPKIAAFMTSSGSSVNGGDSAPQESIPEQLQLFKNPEWRKILPIHRAMTA